LEAQGISPFQLFQQHDWHFGLANYLPNQRRRQMLRISVSTSCLAMIFLTMPAWAENWTQFRGPNADSLANDSQLPVEWGKDKNVQWQVEIPGVAWSSPVIWGDKVFVTTAVTDKQTKPKPGFGFGGGMPGGFPRGGRGGPPFPPREGEKGDRPTPPSGGGEGGGPPPGGFGRGPGRGGFGPMGGGKPPDQVYQWQVYCLDRASGKVLWKQTAAEKKPTIPKQPSNSYASETPITDGERVYAYFGMTGLFCYDLSGKPVWNKDLGSYPMAMGFGTGSSPTLEGDRLFVQCDNEKQSFLLAVDKKTGKELWRVDRAEKTSWSTPFIWRNKERTELVACGGNSVRSYDPASGKQLWELGGFRGQFQASPVADAEMLYVGCGNPFGPRPLFAIRAGASGDLTLKSGETSNAGVAWSKTQGGPAISSPLLYQGYLYILEQNGGFLSCHEAKTGKQVYKERLPQAKGFLASPWAHDAKIFCLDEEGQTSVIQAGPEFKVLSQNKLDDMFRSSPAMAQGTLVLRGVDHLYCIKK
jgi:outer membrane protein assembly factor BamB